MVRSSGIGDRYVGPTANYWDHHATATSRCTTAVLPRPDTSLYVVSILRAHLSIGKSSRSRRVPSLIVVENKVGGFKLYSAFVSVQNWYSLVSHIHYGIRIQDPRHRTRFRLCRRSHLCLNVSSLWSFAVSTRCWAPCLRLGSTPHLRHPWNNPSWCLGLTDNLGYVCMGHQHPIATSGHHISRWKSCESGFLLQQTRPKCR